MTLAKVFWSAGPPSSNRYALIANSEREIAYYFEFDALTPICQFQLNSPSCACSGWNEYQLKVLLDLAPFRQAMEAI